MTPPRPGRPRLDGLDPRICPRCFGDAHGGLDAADAAGDPLCPERLDKHGAAAIVGTMTADTFLRRASAGQAPAPTWRRVRCADGRYRDLWTRADVESYRDARPGRGAGGGRPRKKNPPPAA